MSTKETLTQEYTKICQDIGDAKIKITRLESFIHEQTMKVVELDQKMADLNKAETEVATAKAS